MAPGLLGGHKKLKNGIKTGNGEMTGNLEYSEYSPYYPTVRDSPQGQITQVLTSSAKSSISQMVAANLFEGVCLNSRHPDPRRVWKVGSGARLLPPLCRDPVDLVDPVDPGMRSETSIFNNPSVDFEK